MSQLRTLRRAIYKRRLVSWATMEIRWCPEFMYNDFFTVWE